MLYTTYASLTDLLLQGGRHEKESRRASELYDQIFLGWETKKEQLPYHSQHLYVKSTVLVCTARSIHVRCLGVPK